LEIKNEQVAYENPWLPIRIFRGSRNKEKFIDWHYHKEVEILAILEGSLDVYIEDEFYPLTAGGVVLIGSSQLHRDRSYDGQTMKYLVFQFDLQPYFDSSTIPYLRFFADMQFPLSRLNYIFGENDAVKQSIARYIQEIYDETRTKAEGHEIAISILIRQILLILLRHDTRKLLRGSDHSDMVRLKPVLDYIENNLAGKIRVETASKTANISYYYFVKLFKKAFGMSFVDYINYNRIKRAERILLTREMSIAQVGEAVGLANTAHFYKMFRKYNRCSPTEFRRRMLAWQR
jgi:AraC-like DNA-binding protein